ncbi:hypothetical protein ACFLQK_01360 [bacterium]
MKETIADLVQQEEPPEMGQMATAVQSMDLKLDEETVTMLLEMAGVSSDEVPDRMEEVNRILEAMPVDLTEFILVTYINNLFKAE